MLTLKVLNSDAQLNLFFEIGTLQIVKGADAKFILQLWQPDRKLRYIPEAGAVITVSLLKSDDTTLDLTATNPFADDRSVIEFDLLAADTEDLISQNILVKINEGGDIQYAALQMALQMYNPSQSC